MKEHTAMYTDRNFKSKNALKAALAEGDLITVYQPTGGLYGKNAPQKGQVSLEGPHYPARHTWHAEAWLEGGHIVRVE